MKDPPSWISAECIPNGFEWKDPSKIQVGEIFHLLNHWRDWQDKGLDPLIWVLTCPLFQDVEDPSKHMQTLQQARVPQMEDSDEEVFVLPSSSDLDQGDDGFGDNESLEESASAGNSSDNAEDINLDVESPHWHISHPLEDSSCEHHIHFIDFELITFTSCGSTG